MGSHESHGREGTEGYTSNGGAAEINGKKKRWERGRKIFFLVIIV